MPNLAALRAAIFLLPAKNRLGGTYVPPPAVRGLINPRPAGGQILPPPLSNIRDNLRTT